MTLKQLFVTCDTISYRTTGLDVNYQFVEDGEHLYIYFQGSNQVTDWIRNFIFKKQPYKDMDVPYRVHAGFLAAWKEVEDIIIEKIQEPDDAGNGTYDYGYKWKQITVVGYSHGGALAAFCHECVWFHRQDLRENGLVGYGFEAPRIFASFKVPEELKERWSTFIVIRNKNDIVTHCPPTLFGYTHVGAILKIGKSTKLVRHTLFRCVDAHFQDNVIAGLDELEKYKDD